MELEVGRGGQVAGGRDLADDATGQSPRVSEGSHELSSPLGA